MQSFQPSGVVAGPGISVSGVTVSLAIVPSSIRLASPTASINGTTSTLLALPLSASTNYKFKCWMKVTPSGAENFQIHALAVGAAVVLTGGGYWNPAGAWTGAAHNTAVTTNLLVASPGAANSEVLFEGIVTVGVNATTLQFDVTDTGTTTSIQTGSWLEVETIA